MNTCMSAGSHHVEANRYDPETLEEVTNKLLTGRPITVNTLTHLDFGITQRASLRTPHTAHRTSDTVLGADKTTSRARTPTTKSGTATSANNSRRPCTRTGAARIRPHCLQRSDSTGIGRTRCMSSCSPLTGCSRGRTRTNPSSYCPP